MGASAVLVNTAIAVADNPLLMAQAFRKAVECGYEARKAGLPSSAATALEASASSPLTAFLEKLDWGYLSINAPQRAGKLGVCGISILHAPF